MIPPRHVIRRNLLPPELHAAMVDWGLSLGESMSPSKLIGTQQADSRIRNSLSVSDDTQPPPWHAAVRERYHALAPQLMRELGVAPFDVAEIEFDLVVYNDGAFYSPHIDVAGGMHRHRADRIITTVYYFHAEPKGFTGGALRLHSMVAGPDGARATIDIEPEQNSLVAFAASALHEVRPVHCPSGAFRDSRFAINGWLRRAHR